MRNAERLEYKSITFMLNINYYISAAIVPYWTREYVMYTYSTYKEH